MEKKGFTLAEVLITLGIVGVIAALTIPMLMNSANDKANAAKLSVTVSDFENAMTTMITSEAADDLTETKWAEKLNSSEEKPEEELNNYLKGELYEGETYSILDEEKNEITIDDGSLIYQTKNGAIIYITSGGNRFADVTIDVNGAAKPNICKHDVFQYELGEDGKLYTPKEETEEEK